MFFGGTTPTRSQAGSGVDETKEEVTGGMNAPDTPVMGRGDEYEGGGTNDPPHGDDPETADVSGNEGEEEPYMESSDEQAAKFSEMKRHFESLADEGERNAGFAVVQDMEMMNHVLFNILHIGKWPVEENSGNEILDCLNEAGIADVHSLITMDGEDFKAIGVQQSVFGLVRKLKAMNLWYNSFRRSPDYTSDYDAFMALIGSDISEFMTTSWKPAEPTRPPSILKTPTNPTIPTQQEETAEHVSAGLGSARGKLAEARRLSMIGGTGNPKKSRPRVGFVPSTPTPSSSSGSGSGLPPRPPPRPAPQPPVQPTVQPVASSTGQSVIYVQQPYTSSRASDFDKGGRRSVSDYSTFSNKEQWSKWNRQMIGQAFDHKCETILNPQYVPDPNDPDAMALFDSQQRFMYSVFSKVLTESKAADILRKYSNPKDTNFGDAQSIYADLLDHYEGGAQGRATISSIETKLTTVRLNKTWTKSVSAFVTYVSGLISTHKELTNGLHGDAYYIEKLNNTFEEHSGMSSHIKTLETQEAVIERRLGATMRAKTYEDQLFELTEYATVLDTQYKNRQATRRNANNTERQGRGNNGGRGGGGRGRGGRGNNGRGRGGRGGGRGSNPDYVPYEKWSSMTYDERQAHIRERERRRSQQANTSNNNQSNNPGNDAQSTQAGGPPTTIHVQEQQQRNNAGGNQTPQPGSMIRNMMSNSSQRSQAASQRGANDEITVDGTVYRRANVTYRISKNATANSIGALVDGGANGGLLGADVRLIEYVEHATVDITGVGDAEVKGLKIAQAAAKVETVQDGPIIVIMSQYAELGYGKTIHSKGQMEHFGMIVDDTSRSAGGRQCIITTEGYTIPISIREGLPHIDMTIPSDADMDKYPHVFLTSDSPWDPTILDNEYDETYHDPEDPQIQERRDNRDPRIDDYGFLRTRSDYEVLFRAQDEFISTNTREPRQQSDDNEFYFDANSDLAIPFGDSPGIVFPHENDVPDTRFRLAVQILSMFPNRVRRLFPDAEKLKPYFGWASTEKIKLMLDQTTQHYRGVIHYPFRKHFKSRFPAANVTRLNEWYATDTFFSDTPAADDGIPGHGGCTMMQIFLGLKSHAVYGYPMKEEKQYPYTLEDHIRKVGAPAGILSDNAKAEIYGRAKDLQRMYEIDDGQSEPYYQNQNPAERKIQDVKRTMNNVMDRTGTPKCWWLLAAIFVCSLFLALPNSDGKIPYTEVTGQPYDVSKFMHFHFWQEVFVESHKEGQKEELARWCYPADDIGDELTYWVLLDKTHQLVPRSNVRPATDPLYPNLRQRPKPESTRESRPARPTVETVSDDDEETPPLSATSGEEKAESPIYSMQDRYDVPLKLPRFSPEELIGRTFLYETGDDQTVRATITKKILDKDADNHQRIKMLLSYDDGRIEEVISYNELCDLVAEQDDAEANGETDMFTFREILEFEGPLKKSDSNYMGSSYNVKVAWTDGSITWEPLSMMIKCDPVTLAQFAKEHDLLDKPGWKKLKKIARRAKVLQRMVNANKRAQRYNAIVYKFGVRIPRSVKEAYDLDAANGNTYWSDAMKKELGQIIDYKVFRSLGKNASKPNGYQQIPMRMVFDVKQSLQRKARLVARGDKTNPPRESVYSGVASMRSLRIVCFLAELNGLHLTGGDVGNAYLEAYTTEKVCFRAGKEFAPFGLEGHMLVVEKALYGLRTSGARFHAKFADTLRTLGFKPTYADPDVWYRDAGNCYEYVVVYVDDILTALKDPDKFYKALQSDPWNYKLKNVEEPKYHLGGDFFRDKDGTLCYGAQTYIKRLVDTYKQLFGEMPTELHAPMDKADKPELDDTPLLGPDGVAQFQSLIGACQWLITLSRFDIGQTVMSLGRFRHAPRVGHLDRLKRLVGYLRKRSGCAIRFRTDVPDHEAKFGNDPIVYDWMETVYGKPPEEIDPRAPMPKGKFVRTTSFADANLMHDAVTGRSASGILEFLNQTPIDWLSKRQNQVETATYGSEFMVARQATERIIDLRYTLRSFGVPLDGPAWLFGDNKSVVTSSTIPHSNLSKRWNALSYHKVREAVAGGWLRFEHIPGTENPADILTKPLPWYMLRVFVEPLLMWKGDTNDAPTGSSDPEGSITGNAPVTSPSRELPVPSEASHGNLRGVPPARSDTNANSSESSPRYASRAGVQSNSSVLRGNQYAALADEEDND